MKKTHKKLLGIGGLALVAGITTIAYHIPDAGAVSTAASASVDVSVNVVSDRPEIEISSPIDGAKLTSANLPIKVRYADMDRIEYILTKGDQSVVIPSPEMSGNADDKYGNHGEHDFIYNLKSFNPQTAGYGDYTLKIVGERNSSKIEDSVSFSYFPATVSEGKIRTDENNNPIVDINVEPSVGKVEAIVYGPDGEEAFRVSVDTNGESPVSITLPFSDHNMDSGNYTAKFITYSYNGLGELVPDQTEDDTDLITTVTYIRKVTPSDDNNNTNANTNTGTDTGTSTNVSTSSSTGTAGTSTDKSTSSNNGCTAATNIPNPVLDIDVEEGIRQIEFVVYDASGDKEVFRYKAFVSSFITNHITLPFDLYCLEEGEYLVALVSYTRDGNGNLIPVISEEEAKKNAFRIFYGVSEIPNTGDILSSIDIPYKDLLISGLIVFFIITFIGIWILRREEKEEDRR